MSIVSAYLWGYKDYQAGDKSFETFKKFYPDGELYLKVDLGGDEENYKKVAEKHNADYSVNPINVGKCGDWADIYKLGRECWPKENAFVWIKGIYEACKKTSSKYMVILEEDVFLLKELSILNKEFGIAIVKNRNEFPPIISGFIDSVGGNSKTIGYGGCGGAIINVSNFIKGYEISNKKLDEDWNDIRRFTKLIGWSDMLLQVISMCGGGSVIVNEQLVEPWMQEQGWIPDSWKNYEMVNYLKDINEL